MRPSTRFSAPGSRLVIALMAFALLLTPMVASAAPATPTASPNAGGKPNIVFILTDDLDGTSWKLFPQIQSQLVQRGASFDNYFVTDSLCCPSRSSIFLGEYVHNHQVMGNGGPDGGYQRFAALGHEGETFANWLQADGYQTGMMGKFLNQYPAKGDLTHVPQGWNEWDVPAVGSGYSEFNYSLNENGTLKAYGAEPADYLVDVMSQKGDAFIRQNANAGKPFFLELATYAPHQPATPAPRHADAFPDARAPRDPSFNEADVSDKPAWIQAKPLLDDAATTTIDQLYRKRLQSMLAVDDLVANLVKTLTATGQLDNTYIVFSSDNGFHLGQHRLPSGKQTAFDTDIRVPLVVRGPGVAAGTTVGQLASNVDLAPTFAAWAGATTPATVDGRSLAPLLDGSAPGAWRQAVLVEHFVSAVGKKDPDSETAAINTAATPAASPAATGAAPAKHAKKPAKKKSGKAKRKDAKNAKGIPTYSAFRTAEYTYVEYKDGARELYDLAADPYELDNLAGSASPALLGRLSTYLAALSGCKAETCRTADSAAPPKLAAA